VRGNGRKREARESVTSCYFCGAAGSITKEHVWPKWLHPYAPDVASTPTRTERSIGFTRTGESEMSETPTRVRTTQGSVLVTRPRQVCGQCNGGWMSRLEQEVRPVLDRIRTGANEATYLSAPDARVLAHWATKTAWMAELASSTRQGSTVRRSARRHLLQTACPPEHTTVFLAQHEGKTNFGSLIAQMQPQHQTQHWETADHRDVLVVTLTFLGLTFWVRTDSDWGVPPKTFDARAWHQLWPGPSGFDWPPSRPISDDEVVASAMRYEWLRLPDIDQFRRAVED
jgi:hypothetical protein